MTVLDKYSKEELVHIVDMFRIDMKMEDLRKSKKDILKVMKDKKIDKKHGDKLPSKTAVKEMVKKDKKNPKSSLSKLAKAGEAKGQKKITDLLPKKKKAESKNDKGGAKPPVKKAEEKKPEPKKKPRVVPKKQVAEIVGKENFEYYTVLKNGSNKPEKMGINNLFTKEGKDYDLTLINNISESKKEQLRKLIKNFSPESDLKIDVKPLNKLSNYKDFLTKKEADKYYKSVSKN